MSNNKGIYVEIPVRTTMDALWEHTQNPDFHEQWDLRFSTIDYLPKAMADDPQRFLYTTKIGFGLSVSGEGESVGTRTGVDGERTSALKFWSDRKISLIRTGSGYWKYVPDGEQIRFLTWYDYVVRFGWVGRLFDRFLFRPLIGRATAWSFDCLRLWLEEGISPSVSKLKALTVLIVNLTLAAIWIYQGLVPKILFPDTGELAILQSSGLFPGFESSVLLAVGVGEIVFGLLFLILGVRILHYLNIFALFVLGAGAIGSQPEIYIAPFNPASLNLAMVSLSVVAIVNSKHLASARNCLRRPKKP